MRTLLCGAGAVLALTLTVADVAHAQNPNKPGQKKTTVQQQQPTDQEYAYISSQVKEAIGKITYVDVGNNTLTLRIEFQQYVPNNNNNAQKNRNLNNHQQALMRAQQQLMRDYQSIMTSRNVMQQQQRMMKFERDMQQLQVRMMQAGMATNNNQYKVVKVAKEFDFNLSPDLRVARVNLPTEYDDKGNVATYTKEELKKKQDATMPGYLAKPDDLTVGQTVKLYLGSRKTTKKTDGNLKVDPKNNKTDSAKLGDSASPKTATIGGTGTTPGAQTPPRPYVRLVLIETEPDPASLPKTPQKKKKKNKN